MKLLHSLPFLGLGLSSVALANSGFHYLNHKHPDSTLFKRLTVICGFGSTCAEACGIGYEQCGDSSSNCYNPTAGDTCCGAPGYHCTSGEYCADTEGDCCFDDQDLASCTASLGITVSPATASSTPEPAAATTSTYVPSVETALPTTASSTPEPAVATASTYIPSVETALPTTASSTSEPAVATTSTYIPSVETVLPTSSATFTGAAVKMDVGVTGKVLAAVLGLAGVL